MQRRYLYPYQVFLGIVLLAIGHLDVPTVEVFDLVACAHLAVSSVGGEAARVSVW